MVALLLTSCLYFCFPGQGDQPFKIDPLRFFNQGSHHNQGAILMFVPLQIMSALSVTKTLKPLEEQEQQEEEQQQEEYSRFI